MKAVRVLSVLLALCTLVVGLAACQPKVGAAAVIGTQRLSESNVDDYVMTTADERARSLAVGFLVKQSLYTQFLNKHGGVPSDAVLASYHDSAIGTFVSSNLGTGADADEALDQVLAKAGAKANFRAVLVRSVELEVAAIKVLKAQSAQTFFPQIANSGIKVSIAPRYGTWDSSVQDVSSTKSPGFLVPTATASASPSAAG